MGKSTRNQFGTKKLYLVKYIEGEVAFSIANIFVGKSQSIICIAKEILVKEVMARRKELFWKIPCLEKKVKFQNDNAFFLYFKGIL